MQGGKLRHVITLHSLVNVKNPSTGAITKTWVLFEDGVRADVRFLGGLETLRADEVIAVRKCSMRIRFRPGVVENMRALFDGRNYDIKSVQADDTSRRYLDMVCETGANNG